MEKTHLTESLNRCHREREARGDPEAIGEILTVAPGLLCRSAPRNDLNYFHLPSLKIAPFIIPLFNKAPTSGGVIGTLIQDGRYVINSNEH